MRTKRLTCALLAALMLFCLLPARAAAKTFSEDWSDLAFTMRDAPSGKTVSYTGSCGVPTILLFGGFGTCSNTKSFIENLFSIEKLLEPGSVQAFLFDVNGLSDEDIVYYFSEVKIPQGVYAGPRTEIRPESPIFRMLDLFNGPGNYSYTMPLAAYIDASGTVREITSCEVGKESIRASLAHIGVTAQKKDSADILIDGEFRQTEARRELAMVNALRADDPWFWNADNKTKTVQKNLKPLTYDYDLERVAMQRAVELALRYDHTRPDGSRCFEAYGELGYRSGICGENIAYGFRSAEAVETAWEEKDKDYAGQGHRRNILDEDFTAFGCACFVYRDVCFWVQEFNSSVQSAAAVPAKDGAAVGRVRLPAGLVEGWSAEPQTLSMETGETVQANDRVTLYLHTSVGAFRSAETPKWKPSNAKLLRVDADGAVTALAAGRSAIIATLPSKTGDWTVSVTVETTGAAARIPGDVDGNGKPEAADARLALRAAVGLETYAERSAAFRAADADQNGEITAADARMILRAAVGLEELPA